MTNVDNFEYYIVVAERLRGPNAMRSGEFTVLPVIGPRTLHI